MVNLLKTLKKMKTKKLKVKMIIIIKRMKIIIKFI